MFTSARAAAFALATTVSFSAAAGVPKDLPYPSGSPTAEQIIEQVYYVNHFYGYKNFAIVKDKKEITVLINKAEGKKPSAQKLTEPLSERELEVLRLLKTELNGPEIARSLMVSLNTMRTHTKNIYNKLDVNNRRAAVRRAEELDLL